ncbi:hypothetical protein EG68_10433 [Paragonimus skrjabini miyazakii]|uniref:Uncharacterized protein n=1 Tax=Paragonimus skrjabini miyazakii TaxID=59628 RepID=A0A8S9Y967_9TREM|nr:hypothetical protein EG68_10433 [Paragonimus skrjabini miyazakii]
MDNGGLPPGWERVYSPDVGNYYYVDHNNKTTTWKDPRTNSSSTPTPITLERNPWPTSESLRPEEFAYGGRQFADRFTPPYDNRTFSNMPTCLTPDYYYQSPPPQPPWFPSGVGSYGYTYPQPTGGTDSATLSSSRSVPIKVVRHPVNRSPNISQSPRFCAPNAQTESEDAPSRVVVSEQPDHTGLPVNSHTDEPTCSHEIRTGPANEDVDKLVTPADQEAKRNNSVQRIPIVHQKTSELCEAGFGTLQPGHLSEPVPLSYRSLPNQPPLSTWKPQRDLSSSDPVAEPTKPVPSVGPAEQSTTQSSYEMIGNALEKLSALLPQVESFASPIKDKQYLMLEDKLDKLLLEIDRIDSAGDEAVRDKRRQATKDVLATISVLEHKLANASSINEQPNPSDTINPQTETVEMPPAANSEEHLSTPKSDNQPAV